MKYRYKDESCQSGWNGFGIAAMVISFIVFWPIGLFLVFWMSTGRDVRDLPAAIAGQMRRLFGRDRDTADWREDDQRSGRHFGRHSGRRSGNVMFDEYQQAQEDRIAEMKREIRDGWNRFNDFRAGEKRKADQQEFDRFMGRDQTPDQRP